MNALHRIWLGLGANLGDPPARLRATVAELERDPRFVEVRASDPWRGPYIGPRAPQPAYFNLCVTARTALDPASVLEVMRGMEEDAGRPPDSNQEPRVLDIDLLLFDTLVLEEPGLVLPHPRMRERRFVLEPMAELDPDLELPPDGARVVDLLDLPHVAAQELWPVREGGDFGRLQGSQR